MLTIGKLGASVDQLAYYVQQVAQGIEDYFSGRGEAPGRWIGGGCGDVGVSGQVDRDAFMRAMAGCDPRLGERLRPQHGRTKVAAFDLTFSAPKSVSVLVAIGDEEIAGALLEAHERTAEAAFAYVEREACFTRRGRNGVRRVRGEGFVAAAYRHRLSRAGDPQLHTHVVLANMTRAEAGTAGDDAPRDPAERQALKALHDEDPEPYLELKREQRALVVHEREDQVLAALAAEHLEHAYALTGHAAQGATVEWAGVIGRPSEFTREWAYTSFSRARAHGGLCDSRGEGQGRESYAPFEPERTRAEALEVMRSALRRREAEALAIETVRPQELGSGTASSPVALVDLAEAGAVTASSVWAHTPPSRLRSPGAPRRRDEQVHDRGLEP